MTSRDCSTQIPISLPVFRSPLLGNPALADRTHVHRRCPSRTPKTPERESDPDRNRNHAKHPNFHGVRLLVSNYGAAVKTLRAEVRYEAILTILLTLDDGEPAGGNRNQASVTANRSPQSLGPPDQGADASSKTEETRYELASSERKSTLSSRSCSRSMGRRALMSGITRRRSFARLSATAASIRPSLT